jgi:hypothetical protein
MCYICFMPQLHCYVPNETAEKLKRRAEAEGVSLSRYLAHLLNREISHEWPEGFFEQVLGGWTGEPLTRPALEEWERRGELDFPVD